MSTTAPTTLLLVTVGDGGSAHVFEAMAGGAKEGELREGGRAFDRVVCGKAGELRLAASSAAECRRCRQIVD